MAHILIAEDDKAMGQFLAQALQRAGHSVTLTYDGSEALAALDQPPQYDLLLTDIVMPGVDGIELSQTAARRNPDLKIMFITGFTAAAIEADKTAPQNRLVLSKPFHLNDLVGEIERLLGKDSVS